MNIKASCRIAAPKEAVFDLFSDLENLPKNVSAIAKIEVLSDGKIGVGTKFRETRVMFGRESSETMEITEFLPPDSFREEASSNGMHYISDWTFAEDDGSTTVTIEFKGKATTLTGKMMSMVFSLMGGSMRKAFLSDMSELKEVAERNA